MTTGEIYTNTGADDYDSAVERIQQDEAFTTLFEGERSFDIMVAGPDGVYNDAAARWFMKTRFLNANEKVYVAVDMDYPVNDELREYAEAFSRREGIVWGSDRSSGLRGADARRLCDAHDGSRMGGGQMHAAPRRLSTESRPSLPRRSL